MTVEVRSYSSLPAARVEDGESIATATTLRYAGREYGRGINSFEIRPARTTKTPPNRHSTREKVVRRLEGFLVEDEGEDYKVAFVQDENLIFYYLPASQLRQAGISAPNQPFQMDEVEVNLSTGKTVTGYTFVPLAKPSDAFNDAIDLDKNERRSKLSAIFKKFGKAQD